MALVMKKQTVFVLLILQVAAYISANSEAS
jgi:hypothetical protein